MEAYDPLVQPEREQWLQMDEGERMFLVENYHQQARIRLPNASLHAVIHTVVENQVAMGAEISVEKTLHRLMSEGLDRHEAVHAIGCVLTEHLYNVAKRPSSDDPHKKYFIDLQALSAEGWRKKGQ